MPRAIVPCAKSHGGVKTPPYKTNLKRPPCVKGAGCAIAQTGGLWPYGDKSMYGQGHNPSVTASPCHLPLHKGGFYSTIHNIPRGVGDAAPYTLTVHAQPYKIRCPILRGTVFLFLFFRVDAGANRVANGVEDCCCQQGYGDSGNRKGGFGPEHGIHADGDRL